MVNELLVQWLQTRAMPKPAAFGKCMAGILYNHKVWETHESRSRVMSEELSYLNDSNPC